MSENRSFDNVGPSRRSILALMFVFFSAALAQATPVITSAAVYQRVFNDDPVSILNVTNSYPGLISFSEDTIGFLPFGSENLHSFRLSSDGLTNAVFNNNDAFTFFSDVTITGTAQARGGLSVSPWWSPLVDGAFRLNAQDGEIAAFGGRLPFFSFTADFGLEYSLGSTVQLGVSYDPNGLSAAEPGTIEYLYTDGSGTYSSGWLPFDEGTATEGHGTWGILDGAAVGGFSARDVSDAGSGEVRFENMRFAPASLAAVPEPSTVLLVVSGALGLSTRARKRLWRSGARQRALLVPDACPVSESVGQFRPTGSRDAHRGPAVTWG